MVAGLARRVAVIVAAVVLAGSVGMAPAVADGTGTVQGRITDERGAPSASQISMSQVDGPSSVYSYSEADGRFTIPDVPVGTYRFSVNDNVHPPQEAADVVDVVEGQVTTVDVRYLSLGTLVVRVTDAATGRPVAGACAFVSTGSGIQGCAGADGVARVTGVWPGTWSVDVYDDSGAHWPTTLEGITVERDATTRTRAAIRPAASITATIRDAATGLPVSACVNVVDTDSHGVLAGCDFHSDPATGKVVIGPLEATTARLFVDPEDDTQGALWVTGTGGTGDQRKARVVTATVGRPVRLPAIAVPAAGSISGTVYDRVTGEPASSICTYPYALDPRLGDGRRCTGSTGEYTLSGLGPYAWPVLFTSAPYFGRAWQWSGDVADRFSARTVQVTPGATGRMDARVVDGGTVTGTVVDRSGTPLDASVYAYNARTGDFASYGASTSSNLDRSFVVKGLATQQVKIQHLATGDCWYRNRTTFASAVKVAVTAGASTGPLTLTDCATP